ncbi:MAG: hypothetical protein HG428_003025 [Bacteroidia bacterium]|nr:hypothetical protein [Bacteroidia bacterium]
MEQEGKRRRLSVTEWALIGCALAGVLMVLWQWPRLWPQVKEAFGQYFH